MNIHNVKFDDSQSGLRAIASLSLDGFRMLSRRGKNAILGYSIFLSIIGLLDALALGLLARSFSSSSGTVVSVTNEFVFTIFIVVFLFILRSLLAILISFSSLKSLAREEVILGQNAFNEIMTTNWINFRKLSLSDIYLKVDRAPNALIQNFLFLNATIIAEVFNALIIVALLTVVSPITAVVTGLYFGLVSVAQHFALSKKSSLAGITLAREFSKVYELLSESFYFGKLQRVTQSNSLRDEILQSRLQLAQSRASATFLSGVPRYFMEGVLAFGCLLIIGSAYLDGGSGSVISALAIFAGAGFRLLPIVNKVQGLILVLFSSFPLAKSSILVTKMDQVENRLTTKSVFELDDSSILELKDVSFFYPDSTEPILLNINLKIKSGMQYAIVGESGSGKSTLTEILLGLLSPSSGRRIVSSYPPVRFGYVPQETPILSGTLAQNIAMAWNSSDIDYDRVADAIRDSQLHHFSESYERRIKTSDSLQILLSGGQRQRLGIARALYKQSNCLILDEPTSALDSGIEFQLVEMLAGLRSKTTTITVAHRMTTIQFADEIIHLENGQIVGLGTFQSLLDTSAKFRKIVEQSSLVDRTLADGS